jgi:hypothetical protein
MRLFIRSSGAIGKRDCANETAHRGCDIGWE